MQATTHAAHSTLLTQLVAVISDASYGWMAGYRAALVEVGLLGRADAERLDNQQPRTRDEATVSTASSWPVP